MKVGHVRLVAPRSDAEKVDGRHLTVAGIAQPPVVRRVRVAITSGYVLDEYHMPEKRGAVRAPHVTPLDVGQCRSGPVIRTALRGAGLFPGDGGVVLQVGEDAAGVGRMTT